MRRSEDFSATLHGGARGGSRSVVVHVDTGFTEGEPLVGFAVSRTVGNSVVRHRVQRRLRHLMREVTLDPGVRVVVRALPSASSASYDQLRTDLGRALARSRSGSAGSKEVR